LRLALANGANRIGATPPSLKAETDQVCETLCSLAYHMTDKAQKLSNPKNVFIFSFSPSSILYCSLAEEDQGEHLVFFLLWASIQFSALSKPYFLGLFK
jgi:hypothetical protein